MMRIRSFVSGSFAVTMGTIIGGGLSYLFSITTGRLLGPAQFGDLGAISSLIAIVMSISGAVFTLVMYYSSELYAQGNLKELLRLQRKATKLLFLGSLAVVAIIYIFIPWLSKLFNISDIRSLYIALVSVVFGFTMVVNKGILQGCQRYWLITITNITELGIKLMVVLILLGAGMGLVGASISMVAATAAAFFIALIFVSKLSFSPGVPMSSSTDNGGQRIVRSEIIQYLWPTLAATICILLLINIDVIIIKRLFSAQVAGQYIAVSTVAKIILYISSPISLVMFPLIAEQKTKGEKHFQTLLLSLFVTAAISITMAIAFIAFKEQIVVGLYGEAYRPLSYLLPVTSWLVIVVTLINLMAQYFMSIKSFGFVYYFLAVIVIMSQLIRFNHGTVGIVVHYLFIGSLTILGLMVANYLYSKRSQLMKLIVVK